MAIKDYSGTAADNTAISGISIQGTADVKNFDNAMRQQLADIANWTDSDTLASASTTDLGSVEGMYVSISGTTTITAFGTLKAGMIKFVKFAAALTLTHNATSLILPGAANITTAAGDTAIFVSEGSGNWRCINFQAAAGTAPTVQTFSSSDTWTRPAGCTKIFVEVQAGGGGGGYSRPNAAESAVGGGGGGGAYSNGFIASPASSYSVTVGAAGVGGVAVSSTAATSGGNSSFATSIVCAGGSGGLSSSSTSVSGGSASGGQGGGVSAAVSGGLSISGGRGGPGITFSGSICKGGDGGASHLGAVTSGRFGAAAGESGRGYGAGGSGGANSNATQADGGAGAPGIVIVTEYYN